ncbi:MAG: SsrA-binding protein SmpB [Bdellovibrionales bacterium]|nr:SsrA-binding protein SmpB [Bdellovibrionales bacterium]
MGEKLVCSNKKARHDYHIGETFEAGMVLTGSEVKSMRDGNCQLKDSYIDINRGELFLIGAHVSPYFASSYNNHEPERKRKLLMHRLEISKLDSKVREKGLSLIPLRIYFKKGRAKIEIALAKGKKAHDKRDTIKKRDALREVSQQIKRSR